ncbi:hypothetical protein FPV67DRAFT_1451470 [Lyophyllum atratum]|nr:hypothetical protein FPV67DRAFT_1451470 [Lyophyllum atratum]
MVAPLFIIILALAALPSVGPVGAIVAPQPVDASFIPNPAQIPLDAVANAAAAELLVKGTRRCAAVSFLNEGAVLSRKCSPLTATGTSKRLTSTVTSTSLIPVPHSSVSLHPPPRHSSITSSAPIATVSVLLPSSAIPIASLQPVTGLDIAQPQTTATESDACREPFYANGSFNGTDNVMPLGPICGISNRPVQPTAMVAIIPPKTTATVVFDGPTTDLTIFAIDNLAATANATLPMPVVNRPMATSTLVVDNNFKFRDVVSLATGLFAAVLHSWWTVAGVMLAFITFGSRFPFWAVVGDVETKAITNDKPPVVDIGNAVVDRGPIAKDGVPPTGVNIVEDPVAVETVVIVRRQAFCGGISIDAKPFSLTPLPSRSHSLRQALQQTQTPLTPEGDLRNTCGGVLRELSSSTVINNHQGIDIYSVSPGAGALRIYPHRPPSQPHSPSTTSHLIPIPPKVTSATLAKVRFGYPYTNLILLPPHPLPQLWTSPQSVLPARAPSHIYPYPDLIPLPPHPLPPDHRHQFNPHPSENRPRSPPIVPVDSDAS